MPHETIQNWRPYGMRNMILKSNLLENEQTKECHYFRPKKTNPIKELPEPFYSEQKIRWIETDATEIGNISQDILNYRLNKKLEFQKKEEESKSQAEDNEFEDEDMVW